MRTWAYEDSVSDVANQIIEDEKVDDMVQTIQQAYPVLRDLMLSGSIPSEHLHCFRNLHQLASRMDTLVADQMKIFKDVRDA